MVEIGKRTFGCKSASSAANVSGKVCERPILSTASNVVGFGIDGDQTATRKGPYVRPSALVECQVPGSNRAAPVAQDVCELHAPACPVGLVVGARVIRAAFGPIHFHLRLQFVNMAHHFRCPNISMPGDGIAILAQFL